MPSVIDSIDRILIALLSLVPVLAIVLYFVDNLTLWYTFDVYVAIGGVVAAIRIRRLSSSTRRG